MFNSLLIPSMNSFLLDGLGYQASGTIPTAIAGVVVSSVDASPDPFHAKVTDA